MNHSEIVFILDRSGSMNAMREEAIGGFNAFVNDQKKVPGEAALTLVLFDHEYDVVYAGKRLDKVASLSHDTYEPRGTTALLDAVGRSIDDVGKRLAGIPEHDRPAKVIFAILTDGMENASKDYTRERIADMIQHQQSAYSWEFFFLGANMDAVSVAKDMNIPVANAMPYDFTSAGTKEAFRVQSLNVARSRTSVSPR